MTRNAEARRSQRGSGDCCRRRPALDLDAATARRDVPCLMAMARNRRAGCVVTALQADHLGHQLALHPEPNTDAQRQQPLLRRTGQLARRLLDTIGQRIERPSPIAPAFCSTVFMAGLLISWTCSYSPRSQLDQTSVRTAT